MDNKIFNYSIDNKVIINRFKEKFSLPIDICISTFNRKVYLEKCINSILASTSVKHRIIVHDDGSSDGSKEWLKNMQNRNKIYKVIEGKVGTAEALNKAVEYSDSEIVVIANDDMYFHRYWDLSVMDAFTKFKDCGIVTFYNYTRVNLDGFEKTKSNFLKIQRSGMACTAISRELFNNCGGFNLPKGSRMGYFASSFCEKVISCNFNRKFHYFPVPSYATHMDHPKNILCDRDLLQEYLNFRKENKKGKTIKE